MKNQNEITELARLIEYHNVKYWIEHNPEISDVEFDKLVQKLRELDPNHPILYKKYNLVKNGRKIKHFEPILSLNKEYTIGATISYLKSISRSPDEEFIISPKYDGIHGVLYYRTYLVTRGDGEEGDDISNKLRNVRIVTDKEEIPDVLHGELIISNTYFREVVKKKVFRKDKNEYKTPRNAVAGMLSMLDDLPPEIQIDFIDFDYYTYKYKVADINSELINNIINEIRSKFDYNIDGIVFKLADDNYLRQLGKTSNFYHGIIAYKFPNETAISKIKSIEWTLGINNSLIPTANLEPVELNGVVVSRVTLHNAKYILDNNIKIGTELEIERKGDAVPVIVNVIHREGTELQDIVIDKCPVCNSNQLHYDEPHLYCMNEDCPGNLVKRIAIGLKRLKVMNVGEKVVSKIVSYFKIESIDQIFDLNYSQLSSIGLGYVYNSLKDRLSKPVYDYELLSAICIPGLGKELCKNLCEYNTVEQLLNNIDVKAKGFGIIRESLLFDYNEEIARIYNRLKSKFVKVLEYSNRTNQSSMIVCLSGDFPKPKSFYQTAFEQLGIQVSQTLNKSVNYLIVPHYQHSSRKTEKAEKLGITIISIDDFIKQLKES